MNLPYDVLVLGAGAAGLAAARQLADAGRRVAVLEARDRVGGRILTRHSGQGGMPIELGAEFIHGLPRDTWALVEEARLKTYELDGAQWSFADGLLTADKDNQDDPRQVLETLSTFVHAQPAGDMSFSEYLEVAGLDGRSGGRAANYVEGFNAADRRRIGIAALARQQQAEDAIAAERLFRIESGYDAIPNFLSGRFAHAGGELFLGTRVQSVSWRRGAVAVTAVDRQGNARRLQAERAVIAVPLGVLQAGDIGFSPPPADLLLQADRLVMGSVVRVVLAFRSKFWSDLSFLFTPDDLPATWWTPMPHDDAMLTAWVGGPKAEALQRTLAARGDPAMLLEQCLATLGKVFGLEVVEMERLLIGWHTHDWQADEYSRGAYSYVPAGALDAPARLAVPVDDTLYFAGEHTDTSGHWGTVHAALASGARAARQVRESSTAEAK